MIFEIHTIKVKNKILISDCSMDIPTQSVTVIRGQNGTGKTILLNYLLSESRKQGLSACMMSQESGMLSGKASLLENISLSSDPDELHAAQNLLNSCGFGHLKQHAPGELSGGEKRIICLLRCLFHTPDFLFLDEPTNDLDFHTAEQLKNILISLKGKCTIVAVSHDDRICKIADKIFKIENKKVLAEKEEKHNDRPDVRRSTKNINEYRGETNLPCDSDTAGLVKCLGKSLRSPAVIRILSVLFSAAAICFTFICAEESQAFDTDISIAEDEVDIIVPVSDRGQDILLEGSLPISLTGIFSESISLSEQVSLYQNALSGAENLPASFGLTLEEDERWIQFELEYFLTASSDFVYTLDTYMKENNLSAEPDTSAYFYAYNSGISFDDDAEKLNLERYFQAQENLQDELGTQTYACTYLCVSLQDISFYDFINTEGIQNLKGGNYYIRSKQTVEMTKQLLSFSNKKDMTVRTGAAGILFFLMHLMALCIINLSNRKTLLIYHNSGRLGDGLAAAAKKHMQDADATTILTFATLAAIAAVLFKYQIHDSAGFYMGALVYLVIMGASSAFRKIVTSRSVKKISDWRFR